FQSLLSQLEIHGAGVSTEDANLKFLSTSSTNDVSTTYGVSTSFGHNSQREGSSLYTDKLMYFFFANQSSGPQLDHEDHELVDEFDLEEMDLKWQVAMISMRMKKFYKKTRRKLQFDAKEPVGFDKTKVECFNCHNTWYFARECRSKGNQESRRRDAGNIGYKAKDNGGRPGKQDEPKALVTLDRDGSNTEVISCSKECEESYAKLKKLDDEQREQLGDASIEIQAYSQALKKMSAKDKSRLGYGDQIHEGVLSYENEVLESVFDSRSSDVEDSPVYDRFKKVKGMHAIPPPITWIYMPPKSDFGIDDVETLESVPKPAVNEPKVVSKPKVWFDAPIIEEYESESDDEYVIKPLKEQETSSLAFVNTVKHVKTPRETVKEQNTCSPSPKADKRDWNGLMYKKLGLGYGFTKKTCFVYGSFSHLIRDCDFHEKRMAKQVELNKQKGKGTVNAARQNLSSQAAATSTARKVNTARPILVLLGAIGKLLLRPQQVVIGDPKDITGTKMIHKKLHRQGIVEVDVPRPYDWKTKPTLFVYIKDYNGGLVAWRKRTKFSFTDSECLVLSPDFKLPDENQMVFACQKGGKQHRLYCKAQTIGEESTTAGKNKEQEAAENPEDKMKTARRALFQEPTTEAKKSKHHN
ncbi:hypothetical protein Tco_0580898, partial [Tanacetum coccineum]